MVTDDAPNDPPAGTEAVAWRHFLELLTVLSEATHPSDDPLHPGADAWEPLFRMAEAHAGSKLVTPGDAPPPPTPLSDPGIRRLIAGLIDLASYSDGSGRELRDLRAILASYESADPAREWDCDSDRKVLRGE